MGKKKPLFGVSNYIKRTPKKRPGRHAFLSWYHHNVRITERKQRKMFSNLYYHDYKGKQVVGYICSDEPPQ
jgi:hypothetical protein